MRFHQFALYRPPGANQDPGDSPSEQTGLANRMHEAHLNNDYLSNFGNSVVSLGKLTDELEQMRRNMNR
jgi:insecticidal toxin complex protein TccC